MNIRYPIYEGVYRILTNVFSPKCTKAYVSIFCQSTCFFSGMGKTGSGAFTAGAQAFSNATAAPKHKRFACLFI